MINHMESNDIPVTSHDNQIQDCDDASVVSKEFVTNTFDFTNSSEPDQAIASHTSQKDDNDASTCNPVKAMPLLIFSRPTSLVIHSQMKQAINSSLPLSFSVQGQPKTLFNLALSKLNESSISLAMAKNVYISSLNNNPVKINLAEPSTPDSLTSAPPSYSFVLRQMTARRRPRHMGTFIPSPSFVQHTPPPNYTAAFDIYIDNSIPPPTTRVYDFGFTPIPAVCPECGYTGMTMVRTKVTLCTHLCAFTLCLFCCWLCAPLPYVLRSCKKVYHYCRNCRNYLGMYCPSHPDHNYS